MAVRLNINADVRGQRDVDALGRSVRNLGPTAQRASRQLQSLEAAAVRGRASFAALGTTLRIGVLGGLAAVGFGLNRFIRDTFEAGNLIESLEIRFRLLFGSVSEGAAAFDVLNEFAARVPFSLEEIAAASGNLAVISQGADQLATNLQITGNVAAATGLDFRTTAEQIQRAFAGGIASADIFRERGVRAMLGFQAGATVSVEETVEAFERVFGAGGQFGNATELLARTLTGQVSLVQDAYFQFRRVVQEQFFDALTGQIRNLVGDFQTNGERLNQIATTIGQGIGNALISIERGIRFIVENWQTLNRVIQAFVAFRLVSILGGMAAAVLQFVTATRAAAAAQGVLNGVLLANPIGLIIGSVAALVAGYVAFRDEINTFLAPAINAANDLLRSLGDRTIEFINVGRRIAGLEPFTTFTEDAERAAEAARLATSETEAFRRASMRQAEQEAALDRAASDLVNARNQAMNEVAARQATLRAEIAQNSALLMRDRLLGNLTDMERQILMIKNEILNFELRTGEAVSETADELFAQRQAAEGTSDAARETASALEEVEISAQSVGEAFGRAAVELESVTPAIEMAQEMTDEFAEAWEAVDDQVQNLSRTLSDNIIQGIQEGASAFDILRQTAFSVLSDIANQLIRSGISGVLGGFGGSRGGGSGIFGAVRGIFGFQDGGVVPGGPPFTDRIPALLTPGEVVIPRDQVNSQMGTSITNINISGNVDQRSIEQIRGVIASSSSQVGGANNTYMRNTAGLRNRRT